MKRIAAGLIGFIAAPLIAATLVGAMGLIAGRLDLDWLLKSLPVFYFFSLLATILFGSPIFFTLLYFNLISWWSALGAGILAGFLTAIAIRFPGLVQINDLMVMGLTGAASSFGFWLIWRQGS